MQFTIRPAGEADFPRIVAILNSQFPEPISMEEYLRAEKLRNPDEIFYRVVAEGSDGEVWGFGVAHKGSWHKPGHIFVRSRVDKPYQGRGAGGTIYRDVERFAIAAGAQVLETNVRDNDPEALQWLLRMGFTNDEHMFESTLSLQNWDPTPFEPALATALEKGVKFLTLSDAAAGEEMFPRFYALYVRLMRDVPVFGENPFPPYAEWLKHLKGDPHWTPDLVLIGVHEGRWVAMTDLGPSDSGGVYQRLTAVDREYRGMGISLAIKVLSLKMAKAQGYSHTRTNNHSANAPMLATNRRLGYQPEPGFFHCTKKVKA